MPTTSTPPTTTKAITKVVIGAEEVIVEVEDNNHTATCQNKPTSSQIK